MLREIKADDLTKTDLRLHPGQMVRIDVSDELCLLRELLSDNHYLEVNDPVGYYLYFNRTGMPDIPLNTSDFNYYYYDDTKTLVDFDIRDYSLAKLAKLNRDIFSKNQLIFVSAKHLPCLRDKPTTPYILGNYLTKMVKETISCFVNYMENRFTDISESYIHPLLKNEYNNPFFKEDLPLELIDLVDEIDKIVHERIIKTAMTVALANPNMLFKVRVYREELVIQAEEDYRVKAYYELKAKLEELENVDKKPSNPFTW